jgi:branched-chain amino acid transport system ATP-binding protein
VRTLVQVTDLRVSYGPVTAIQGVSISVAEGEIVALVGSNGAGKSSLLRAILGLAPVSGGTIEVAGSTINGRRPHWIASHLGFAYVAEDRGIFGRLTVEENLDLGFFPHRRRGRRELERARESMYELFPRLPERRSQLAGTLSGGEQQMVAMAKALISSPKLLLLDEPSLGLAPLIVEGIFERLETVRASGTSILLVEQNSQIAFDVSTRGYVMERGQIVIEGDSAELARDERVRAAYLGVEVE